MQNADRLDSEIIYDRDFDYDYFGFKVRLLPIATVKIHRPWTLNPPLLPSSNSSSIDSSHFSA